MCIQSTIVSEGFKGGTRGAPIMPRDAVSRTANVERTGRHKWVKLIIFFVQLGQQHVWSRLGVKVRGSQAFLKKISFLSKNKPSLDALPILNVYCKKFNGYFSSVANLGDILVNVCLIKPLN